MHEPSKAADLSRLGQILFVIAAGLIALGLIMLAIIGKQSAASQVMIAVGASILASLIVQTIYMRVAQERVIARVVESSTEAAISHTRDVLKDHFSQVVPRRVYPKSRQPTETFRQDFAKSLQSSRIYRHKGDEAGFAAFRLTKLAGHEAILGKEEITFCIVDPSAEALIRLQARRRLRSDVGSYSRDDVENTIAKIRRGIFTTLIALFDVCHQLTINVYLHREPPFFRAEIFDGELFVSYYLGGNYPGTYQFDRETYVYEAFLLNFNQIVESSEHHISFHAALSENEFSEELNRLGCKDGIDYLRCEKDRYHASLEKEVSFDTTMLF